MRWIYLSPHFDDAVLSCGGLIWEQAHSGNPVEIWTLTAGDPDPDVSSSLIARVHEKWQTGSPLETIASRRIEDQNAARSVGASVRHLGLVDALYRRASNGSMMYDAEDVFVPIHPLDGGIVKKAADQISPHLKKNDTVVCPLSLGGHVDHIITRLAAEKLKRHLWYYADIPYLFKHKDELAPATDGMNGKTFLISEQGLAAWQDGIASYTSQISSLFSDISEMRSQIKDYRLYRDGLTIWERA